MPVNRGWSPRGCPALSLPIWSTFAAGSAIVGRRAKYCESVYGITVLSASLPPLRYSTTRLRRELPCASARSDRNRGAVKPTVKAVTPPRTNARLVIVMRLLHQLVLARSDDQMDEPGGLGHELRVGAGPGAPRVQVIDECLPTVVVQIRRPQAIERL